MNGSRPLCYPDPIPTDRPNLAGLPSLLDFAHLADRPAPFAHPRRLLATVRRYQYLRLVGAGVRREVPATHLPPAALDGLLAAGRPIVFVVANERSKSRICVGFHDSDLIPTANTLHALLGGPPPLRVDAALPAQDPPAIGCLIGEPETEQARSVRDADRSHIDTLLDALRGESFSLLLFATPEPRDGINRVLQQLQTAGESIDRLYLQTQQQSEVDRLARHARDILDARAQGCRLALDSGAWRTTVLLMAGDYGVVRHGLALIAAEMRCREAKGSLPLHGYRCADAESGINPHSNLWTSARTARMCGLPARDRRGFSLVREAAFHVDGRRLAKGIAIGEVLDGSIPLGDSIRLDEKALCRHALVTGHTGSGKSTTVRTLLQGVAERGLPFLVLDPVKPIEQEYATLISEIPDLCCFRIGAPMGPDEYPFRMNPFAFPQGFPLFTHIDFLKAAFTAAFGLFPPTPYLLETSIYRSYARRGWNMATGQHPHEGDALAFPTLSDLLDEIVPVVDEAGYSDEITRNLKGALRTRIGNLCVGPKGMVLDTRSQIPDRLLFEVPTILELKSLGATDEQALVMGLVLTRLLEVRQMQGLESSESLRHLVVIEEAHRLLKKTSERSTEESNMAHQAVQTFVNLIAEIRAYGESIVVVEQLPSNLNTQVVKQAGMKIVHRMTPGEDRTLVGDAMVLDEAQKRSLATLPTGVAVAFADGFDGAMRIGVRPPRGPGRTRPREKGWRKAARLLGKDATRLAAQQRRTLAEPLLRDPALAASADGAVAAILIGAWDGMTLDGVSRAAARSVGQSMGSDCDESELTHLAIEDAWRRRALEYRLRESELNELCEICRQDPTGARTWAARRLAVEPRPEPWCVACPAACQLRYEGRRLANEARLQDEIGAAILDRSCDLGREARISARGAANRLLPGANESRGLIFCALGHVGEALRLPGSEIEALQHHYWLESWSST